MRIAIAAGLALLLLGFIASFTAAEEPGGGYSFDTREKVSLYAWAPGNAAYRKFLCPMLPGRQVTIPAGWTWELTTLDREPGSLGRLQEHLIAGHVNKLIIGHRLDARETAVLKEMPWLEKIEFRSLLIQGDWIRALDGCTGLKMMAFNCCEFEDDALSAVCSSSSKAGLSLSRCALGEKQWEALTGNPRITDISVGLGRDSKVFDVLATLSNLETLAISGVYGNEEAIKLRSLGKLRQLYLFDHHMVTRWDDVLSGLQSLESLLVTRVDVEHDFLAACAKLPNLAKLDFSNAQFSHWNNQLLAALSNLKELRIADCYGVTGEAFENMKSLTTLHCTFGVLRALGSLALSRLQTLKTLVLEPKYVRWSFPEALDSEAAEVVCGLPNLKRLVVTGGMTDDAAAKLSRMSPLITSLTIDYSARAVEQVAKMSGIQDLTLDVNGLESLDSLSRLAVLPNLRSLTLFGYERNPVDDSIVEALLRMPNLEEVDLSRARKLTSAGILKLSALPRLTWLEPTFSDLAGTHHACTVKTLMDLVSETRKAFCDKKLPYPGSLSFTADKWEPLKQDTYCGYRFRYFSNSSTPTVDDADLFAFVAIPLTLDDGHAAFLYAPGIDSDYTFATAPLSPEDLNQLNSAEDRDFRWSNWGWDAPSFLNRIPFYRHRIAVDQYCD
ncbi:MAG: hypothetical protein WC712_12695 [Candidatus Brocadiia bacterium]